MITLEPGTNVFIRWRGRVWRGVVTWFPFTDGTAQVRTEMAAQVCHRWKCISFWLRTGWGTYARDAELIIPQSMAEWAALEHEADNPPKLQRYGLDPLPPQYREPKMRDVTPRAKVSAPVQQRLPYSDRDDDGATIKQPTETLPEGYEPGEQV